MAKFPKPYFRSQRGTWCVQLDGNQVTLGTDKDAAFRLYHQLMGDRAHQRPTQMAVVAPHVATILDQYLDWLNHRVREGTKAARTFQWYCKYLQSFLLFKGDGFTVAGLTIDKLEPFHVYQWVDSHPRWKTGKRGAMTAVQRAFSWAAKAGALKAIGGKSPLSSLEKPPPGRREQCVTEQEYADVLGVLTSQEATDLTQLSWETGMRPHELFICEARFFEPQNGRMVFPLRFSKGKKLQRVVYLNDTALEIVRRLALQNPAGPMLRNTEGEPWNAGSVNCLFQRVRLELGRRKLHELGLVPPRIPRLKPPDRVNSSVRVEHERAVHERRKQVHRLAWDYGTKYSLYAFRHAFCTEALENGVDAVTVSVLMGHRDTTMIARHYAHVHQRQDHMRAAANRARGA